MEPKQIEALLERYNDGKASADEMALLESWYLSQGKKLPAYGGEIDYQAKKQELWQAINKRRGHNPSKVYPLLPRLAAAASIVLAVGLGWYFFLKPNTQKEQQTIASTHDAAPGSNKAILTLADGSSVELDSHAKGTLAMQGNTAITKNGQGLISYNAKVAGIEKMAYNTITTPNGGEYQVLLPDGTHVWLNAASSLRYPVAFTGKERRVELTGEAYFEVAHNKAKPFKVITGLQSVEVLGTHFNINAYSDEAFIRTTLLEGSVKVIKSDDQTALLKPGQEACVGSDIKVQEADTYPAVAWKNGKTYFKDADIQTIMRSITRWYNIEVVYKGTITKELFTGGISRKSNLSNLLRILETGGIHARIDNRRIIITP